MDSLIMKLALGLLTIAAVLIAYSAAKSFWSGPIEAIKMQVSQENAKDKGRKAVFLDVGSTPIPTTTSTSTSTLAPCSNGCILTVGTSNAPTAPPSINTNYNGRNPLIQSYPTTQP